MHICSSLWLCRVFLGFFPSRIKKGGEQSRWRWKKKTHPQMQDVSWLLVPPVALLLCKRTKKGNYVSTNWHFFGLSIWKGPWILQYGMHVEYICHHLCTISWRFYILKYPNCTEINVRILSVQFPMAHSKVFSSSVVLSSFVCLLFYLVILKEEKSTFKKCFNIDGTSGTALLSWFLPKNIQ